MRDKHAAQSRQHAAPNTHVPAQHTAHHAHEQSLLDPALRLIPATPPPWLTLPSLVTTDSRQLPVLLAPAGDQLSPLTVTGAHVE